MSRASENWVRKARQSPKGWTGAEVSRLLLTNGFVRKPRAKTELVYYHPDFPEIRVFLTKSSGEVAPAYVRSAVEAIESVATRRTEMMNALQAEQEPATGSRTKSQGRPSKGQGS